MNSNTTDKIMNKSVNNSYAFAEQQTELFNKVLRGEISAVEGYRQVIDKFKNDPKILVIQNILNDHVDTVEELKKHINFKPTTELADQDSGVWGKFVATYLATAKILGEGTTTSALIDGEEHGLKQYMELMKDPDLSLEDKNLIKTKFIPRQERHIRRLEEM